MNRLPVLSVPLAALLAGSALVAVAGTASADVPTCQGRAATIVGPTNGRNTDGTDGDDVVVTTADGFGGTGYIRTGAGNDLLCIVAGDGRIPHPRVDSTFSVSTGAGDDSVVVQEERNTSYLRIALGAGADTFLGSSRPEHVWAGDQEVYPARLGADADIDRISTGDGADTIATGSPDPSVVNDDVVDSGPGGDTIHVGGTGTALTNGGAPGELGDGISLHRPGWAQSRVTIDNVARQASADAGVFLRWTNVSGFSVVVDSPVTYVGSAARDFLDVRTTVPVGLLDTVPVDVDMAGGDDMFTSNGEPVVGRVDGGTGTDELYLPVCSRIDYRIGATVDCKARTSSGDLVAHRALVPGWEGRTFVLARKWASVTGTSGDDTITVKAPRIRVSARGGDDAVTVAPDAHADAVLRGGAGRDVLTGGTRNDTLVGGPGRDRLVGLKRSDTLIGGPGRDVARGGTGGDRCSAEVTRSCER